jgi:hypothetical protein
MICDVHGYADLAHRHPDRIASYIMLPLLHMDAAPLSEHQIHRAALRLPALALAGGFG